MLASRSRAIRTRSVSLVCRARPTCGRGCNFSNVSLSLRLPAKSLGVNSCLVASAADPPTRRTRPRSCSSGATLAREQSGKRMSDLTQPTYARNRPRMRTRATAGSRMRRPSTRRSTGQCARHAGSAVRTSLTAANAPEPRATRRLAHSTRRMCHRRHHLHRHLCVRSSPIASHSGAPRTSHRARPLRSTCVA